MLDRRSRSLIRQVGTLIVLNLVLGFSLAGTIDNAAHIGGLLAGLWLGLLLLPARVPTLSSQRQGPPGSSRPGHPKARQVPPGLWDAPPRVLMSGSGRCWRHA